MRLNEKRWSTIRLIHPLTPEEKVEGNLPIWNIVICLVFDATALRISLETIVEFSVTDPACRCERNKNRIDFVFSVLISQKNHRLTAIRNSAPGPTGRPTRPISSMQQNNKVTEESTINRYAFKKRSEKISWKWLRIARSSPGYGDTMPTSAHIHNTLMCAIQSISMGSSLDFFFLWESQDENRHPADQFAS